jgi:tetratricopeptide (TPR) repeat protein
MRFQSVMKLAVFAAVAVCVVPFVIAVLFLAAGRGARHAPRVVAGPPVAPPVEFGDAVPPTDEDARAFGDFFSGLGGALARGDAAAVGAAFDPERFTAELDRTGLFDRLPGDRDRNRQACARSVRPQLGQALAANEAFRWDRVEVRRVRWSPDRTAAVVFALHRHPEAVESPLRVRWWLVRTAAGWQVYDVEELDLGVRMTALIGLVLTPDFVREFGADPSRFQAAVRGLREAAAALVVRRNADEAELHLDAVRRVNLPPVLVAVVRLIEARILLEKLNPDEAVRRIDEADRLHPGLPVSGVLRGLALTMLDRPDEALPLVRKYLDDLGGDPTGHAVEGLALERLERTGDAAAAYRKALDEAPDLSEALDGLRRVIPDDAKGELGTRLARAARPAALYDEAHEFALEAGDHRAIEELQLGLWKAAPDDARGVVPALRRMVAEKQFAAAAAEVRRALGRVPADKQAQVLNAYLYAMTDWDRHLEAYSAAPRAHAAEAFLTLAGSLDDELTDNPDGEDLPGSRAAAGRRLRDLVAAHRKAAPGDPWLEFYTAALLQEDARYAEAERVFAAAHAVYLRTARPAGEDDRDWRGGQFRSRRVACLYALKQGLRAFAEVGPPDDTFDQLAYQYLGDRNPGGLEALVAARFWRSPGDPLVLYWSAEALRLREEPGRAAEAYRAFARVADDKGFRRRHAVTESVRHYLRADRPADARAVVEEFGADQVFDGLRAAVALAAGRTAEAEQILAALAASDDGPGHAYYDEDFARTVARPEHAELRKKYPDPRSQKPPPKKD